MSISESDDFETRYTENFLHGHSWTAVGFYGGNFYGDCPRKNSFYDGRA